MAKQTNQEKAITALLTTDTVAKAAAACGLSEATLYRYLREDTEFLKEYRIRRKSLMESSIGRLQMATDQAVHCLRRNMGCGKPASEIAAARTVLENAVKGIELTDVIERLEALENAAIK